MILDPYSLEISSIAKQLESSLANGLSIAQAREHLLEYGENQVPEHQPKKRARILIDQLADPILYLLMTAAVIAFFFQDWLEGLAILFVILISVGIGFGMELRATRSLEALRKMGQATAVVIRSGTPIRIQVSELVPGDIVLIENGDVIPADARLVEVDNLTVKESALTGESVPVPKKKELLPLGTALTEQINMIFKGTTVLTGSGKAIVTATGKNTQLGNIQQLGINAKKEATPLEKRLNELGKWLIWLTLALTVVIIVSGYLRGRDLILMVQTGLALAVAAIPEGLPIVATIALAQGMMRLSKKQVIIKKMDAVESLGSTTVICTDKTGTLTEDKMRVHTLLSEDGSVSDIPNKNLGKIHRFRKIESFHNMFLASILCNNVKETHLQGHGDSLEIALMDFAKHMGYDPHSIRKDYPEILELPFNSDRKLMATIHRSGPGFQVFVKGAFESVVLHCTTVLKDGLAISFENIGKWHQQVHTLAAEGLRTIAVAHRTTEKEPTLENVLQNLTFLGVIGCMDPARNDVGAIIDIYKKAGIKVVMVTGDHPGTSQKIAMDIGLLTVGDPSGNVLQGENIKKLGEIDADLTKELLQATVFARTTPEQKLNLVHFYQKNNHVVGMIGDGINDVPALRKADIGIAMGIRGTGAAREAADVILKNDRFTAVGDAIRQGRVVFQNIRLFAVYLLSCNLAEILTVGVAALLNLPSPLMPLQILFLNMVTDTFPALALGMGRGQKNIMEQPPRNPQEPIMRQRDWRATTLYAVVITAAVLSLVVYSHVVLKLDSPTINNMAFLTLVLAQLLNVFNMPGPGEPLIDNQVFTNIWVWVAMVLSMAITVGAYLVPAVALALSLRSISIGQLSLIIQFSISALLAVQLIKLLGNIFLGRTGHPLNKND